MHLLCGPLSLFNVLKILKDCLEQSSEEAEACQSHPTGYSPESHLFRLLVPDP